MSDCRPQVKICGIQPGDSLSFTRHAGVHFIGIIFVAKSRRYVNPSVARDIVKDADCPVVGVFSNATMDAIEDTCHVSGIEIAQLHGDESRQMCQHLKRSGLAVWKAISVAADGSNIEAVRAEIDSYADVTEAILLDTKPVHQDAVTGGHGKSFDWRVLKDLQNDLKGLNWWVAGGIRPDNVEHLLSRQCPTGIDVSSGVEIDGRKDSARISQLIEAVIH